MISRAAAGDAAIEHISPETVDRSTSYKSPVELLSAPSSGRFTIAGRRLGTGEVVQPEVIHLQDFPAAASSTDAGGSATDAFDNPTSSPSTPTTPASVPTAASTSTAGAAAVPSDTSHTIQETTKTSEQVYVTHATVAAAAAAAGGLVGGVHIPIRTAANVAEAALDPASVVDFDCASPTAPAAAAAVSTAAISPHTPAAGVEAAAPSSPAQQLQGQAEPDSPTGAPLAATTVSTSHQGAAVQGSFSEEGGEGIAGHAVLPEDRDEVAATLQRLRVTGQLPGPHSTAPAGPGAAAGAAPDTADLFVGTSTTATSTSSSSGSDSRMSSSTSTSNPSSGPAASSFAGAAGHPSAHGVSAATAAPAKAGYPDPTSAAATVETSPELSAGMQPAAGSSGGLLAMHDAAARAAAVAGALVHIGQPVTTAAALAGTATQPAQAVEATSGLEESSPATSTAARVGSLHQQHTLAEFLLDESADAAISAEHRSQASAAAGAAGNFEDQPDLSAAAAAAAGGDDDVEVQLDVGRSTRLLGSDGRVAAAAAAVPEEALAAIQADTAGLSDAPSSTSSSSSKTPQHPSLRQLSLSSRAHEQAQPTGQLPYGLKVADIVAATVASEQRSFRVRSPRSSPVGATSPRSGRDSFFTASSGSDSSTPRADTAAPTVERSSSPLSASATRAIFESVQLAVQQEQLAGAAARSGSLGPVQQQVTGPTDGGDAADASVTGRIASSGSGDSTATSSRSASEGAAATADPAHAGADAPFADMTGSSSSARGGPAAAAAAAVAEENAAVMQEMQQQRAERTAAASGGPAVAEAESSASTASLCGDSDDYKAGAVSSTAVSEVPSSNVSAGDRLAAAVAAEAANDIGAAAAGMDVAATAAPAFPAVLFGPGPMPVDVAASRSPTSADSAAGSMGLGSAAVDASEAAALTSAGMEALAGPAAQDAIPAAVEAVSALQHVVDATSTAVISSAGMDGAAVAAATAASAATERHAGTADPLAAAQDAAQLVVDAARAVPGLLEPSEVASAAAAAGAAGAAAAAAATPGMDAAAAAAACAAAAAAPLADPASVDAAAAEAVASVETDAAALPTVSTPLTSAGQTPIFAPMSTPMQPPAQPVIYQSGMVGLAASSSQGVQAATVEDLGGLLPILAPSGCVGDTVILTGPGVQEGKEPSASSALEGSSALLSTCAGGGTPAAWNASAPGQLHSILEGSESGAAGSAGGYLGPAADASAAISAGGTTELLNAEGLSQSRMFDPLIVQLALASSVPLEGLGLDAALVDVSGAVPGVGRDTSRSSSMARGSGTLMMQQHPLAGAESLGISTSLGPGPAEGGNVLTHLAAAAAAMSELDSKLQRQRTDSISLGAGHSSRPGDLDAALAAMAGSAAAEAPAGPTDEGFEGGSSSVQV